jgi:hypothetical protein
MRLSKDLYWLVVATITECCTLRQRYSSRIDNRSSVLGIPYKRFYQTAFKNSSFLSRKMPKNYSVTTDEKEFKIPHVNLAYDHGMVSNVRLLSRFFFSIWYFTAYLVILTCTFWTFTSLTLPFRGLRHIIVLSTIILS